MEDFFNLKKENRYEYGQDYEYKLNEDKASLNEYVNYLINELHDLGNLRVYAMDENGNTVYETKEDQSWLLEALAKNSYMEKDDLKIIIDFMWYLSMMIEENFLLKVGMVRMNIKQDNY